MIETWCNTYTSSELIELFDVGTLFTLDAVMEFILAFLVKNPCPDTEVILTALYAGST